MPIDEAGRDPGPTVEYMDPFREVLEAVLVEDACELARACVLAVPLAVRDVAVVPDLMFLVSGIWVVLLVRLGSGLVSNHIQSGRTPYVVKLILCSQWILGEVVQFQNEHWFPQDSSL